MATTVSGWGDSGDRPDPNHDLDPLFAGMTTWADRPVACSAEAAWALVSAIERIGEFSPECVEAHWLPGFPARAVGGRFEGRNRVTDGDDAFEWVRPCTVLAWQPQSEFSWSVGDRFDGTPASRWTFRIQPAGAGVLLRQEFSHYPDGLSGIRVAADADPDRAPELVAARLDDLRTGMNATLERMAGVLEPSTPADPSR